jgi:diguanylate cyclase (GGDEF)-like protein/PAS domain S-box-containing protein
MSEPRSQPFSVYPGGANADRESELSRLRAEIEARDRQETAVAELGQAALTGVDPFILLGQACALVELTLGVTHCRALELTPGGRMLARAAIGTNESFNQCRNDDEEDDSIGMFTLLGDDAVTFAATDAETRFKCSHLRDYHRIQSGAGVTIRTQYGPFGVLLAYCNDAREFRDYELAFLKSTANIVGEAMMRGRTESALRKSELRLRQLIASALDAVVTVDRNGIVVEWNPQAEATFGIAARQILGRPLPSGEQTLLPVLQANGQAGVPVLHRHRMESIATRANGEAFPVEITIEPVGSGAEQLLTAFIRDISERKRAQHELEHRERRFRTIFEKSWSGVALLDADLNLSFAGSSTQNVVGYDEFEMLGMSLLDYVHPRERDATQRLFIDLASSPNKEAHGELRFLHKNGTWIWLEGFAQNMLHETSVGAIVLNYRDVSLRRMTEKQLEYRAHYDALTDLPNRVLFRDRVTTGLAQARRYRRGLAIMYLDLDHFKLVNDGLGHSFGDALLAAVARRLQSSLRASDTISRIGGDEFSILIADIPDSEAVAGVARKLLDSFDHPFRIDKHDLYVTASIGISLHPSDGDDFETLVKCADAAMYRAKELGRNQAQLFTPSMNERYVRRLAIEQSLHHAIEREELELHYQPIYDRARRRVVAFEALVRWNDPTRGLVAPSEFIGLAEETGLIIPIGKWVLRRACKQLREWCDRGHDDVTMSVNISAHQLQQTDFVDMLRDALLEHDVSPVLLMIEITETAAMQNIERTMRVLREVKAMGISIAIDDFGTGMSSLVYLKQFPIDTIKIDKAFMRDVMFDETTAAIVSYVITLAHTLRLHVVAEGVETEEQYSFLRHYACDRMQGYLFSKPVVETGVQELITRPMPRPRTLETRLQM